MPLEFTDELLSAYLDGELSPAERAQVESQLAADPQARQLVEELRALSGAVRDLPRHTANGHFSQRVVQAALAARANQNGEVTAASLAGAPVSPNSVSPLPDSVRPLPDSVRPLPDSVRPLPDSVRPSPNKVRPSPNKVRPLPNKVRRGRRLPVVLAGAAAVAAAVAIMVWFANPPAIGPGGGAVVKGPDVHGPVVTHPPSGDPGTDDPSIRPQPADASAVENALARLRLAIPQEGDGLVLRLRISGGQSPSEALDAALAAAGLEYRLPEDDTTGAHRFASDYQHKLAEKIAGQPAEATLAAADAVFVTAPLDKLEMAIAALASKRQTPLEIAPLMSGRVVLESGSEGEHPSAGPPKPKHFAQRLAAEQFRLEKSGSPLAEITPSAAAHDPARPVRVLILVEP